jgi:ammonium transporter Rh
METETTSLLPTTDKGHSVESGTTNSVVNTIFIALQAVLFIFFVFATTYSDEGYDVKEYIAFRDIMAMLLLGFGYLMTFLKNYGLGAVGLTMMLSVMSMELNIFVELMMRFLLVGLGGEPDGETSLPLPIGMAVLIDSEFAAATLM